jgi:hypothetical protein
LGIDGMSSLDHVKLSQNFMKSSIFFYLNGDILKDRKARI